MRQKKVGDIHYVTVVLRYECRSVLRSLRKYVQVTRAGTLLRCQNKNET